jgi:hypothetical protein
MVSLLRFPLPKVLYFFLVFKEKCSEDTCAWPPPDFREKCQGIRHPLLLHLEMRLGSLMEPHSHTHSHAIYKRELWGERCQAANGWKYGQKGHFKTLGLRLPCCHSKLPIHQSIIQPLIPVLDTLIFFMYTGFLLPNHSVNLITHLISGTLSHILKPSYHPLSIKQAAPWPWSFCEILMSLETPKYIPGAAKTPSTHLWQVQQLPVSAWQIEGWLLAAHSYRGCWQHSLIVRSS